MWVLEAWKDAEKVWYPVVWEEVKDASNVIDYNIRPEQTKDMSAEINANNQTTTGMATVIPWVNAPKLLESTSIISTKKAWYIRATISWDWGAEYEPWEQRVIINYIASDTLWEPQYKISGNNNSRIVIPADWTYQLDITYPQHWSFVYWVTRIYDTNSQWLIVNHVWQTWSATTTETETLVHEFKKWATIYAIVEYYYTWSWTWANRNPTLTMTITRLW